MKVYINRFSVKSAYLILPWFVCGRLKPTLVSYLCSEIELLFLSCRHRPLLCLSRYALEQDIAFCCGPSCSCHVCGLRWFYSCLLGLRLVLVRCVPHLEVSLSEYWLWFFLSKRLEAWLVHFKFVENLLLQLGFGSLVEEDRFVTVAGTIIHVRSEVPFDLISAQSVWIGGWCS